MKPQARSSEPVSTRQAGWRVDRQYSRMLAAMLVIAYAWTIMPTGLQWQNTLETAAGAGVGPWFKVQWVPLFGLASWVVWDRWALFTHLVRYLNPFGFALCLWMLCSALWAPDPGLAVRQAIIIIGVMIFATSQVLAAWQPRRFEDLVRWTLSIIGLVSLAVALALPEIGIHQKSQQFELNNAWRGIGMTKYFLGHVAEFSAILWFHAWAARRVNGWMALAFSALSLLLLIKSRNNTSMVLLLVGITLVFLVLRPPLRLRETRMMVRIALVLLLFAPLFIYMLFVGEVTYRAVMEPVSGYFGKDITISGRTHIWEQLWISINASSANFWLGVGYMNFWNGPGSLADGAYRALRWPCPNGHNIYLDMWNELGLIGLLLLLSFLSFHAMQLRRLTQIDLRSYALHLAILAMTLIENLTASAYFRAIQPAFLLIVCSSLSVSRLLLEQQLRAAAAGVRGASGGKLAPAAPHTGATGRIELDRAST